MGEDGGGRAGEGGGGVREGHRRSRPVWRSWRTLVRARGDTADKWLPGVNGSGP